MGICKNRVNEKDKASSYSLYLMRDATRCLRISFQHVKTHPEVLKNTEKTWAYLWNFTVFFIYSIIIITFIVVVFVVIIIIRS